MESFTQRNGAVRIVVSTVAFADVPDIHTVLHWGPPSDLECYVQETGCGGRDGQATDVILYYAKKDFETNEAMNNYCNNFLCRTLMLMTPFCEVSVLKRQTFVRKIANVQCA